jgi:alpha 1,2-mannosyltransferase
LISVLKHLKRLGTNLPVEVFHYEDELHDSDQRRQIEAFGAVLKIVRGVSKEAGAWKVSGRIIPVSSWY